NASAAFTRALHAFVCACSYCPRRGCFGSSRSGSAASFKSARPTSNFACAWAGAKNHWAIGRPARPGRALGPEKGSPAVGGGRELGGRGGGGGRRGARR